MPNNNRPTMMTSNPNDRPVTLFPILLTYSTESPYFVPYQPKVSSKWRTGGAVLLDADLLRPLSMFSFVRTFY